MKRLALTPILILFLTLSVRSQQPTLGVTETYDRFANTTTVRYTMSLLPDRPGFVLFSIVADVKGQNTRATRPRSATILLSSVTDEWYFLKSVNTLRIIQDGKRYELGRMQRSDSSVGSTGVTEHLSLGVPLAAIVRFSQAKSIELQVGKYEAKLSESQIQEIGAWLAKFKPAGAR